MRNVVTIPAFALLLVLTQCKGQSGRPARSGLARFENSEFMYRGLPTTVPAVDTSPAWPLPGQRILLTGVVYRPDGKTPAPGVLLYYYHTNTAGRYIHDPKQPRSMPPNGQGQTHGFIRGWVKTDTAGRYAIYTTRPGVYPTRDEPAHIHITVKEPREIPEYYLDDFVFDDDPLLTGERRRRLENRGGSGVLRLVERPGMQVGERDLYLGLNIPGYAPGQRGSGLQSGPEPGEEVRSFIPFHAWGPDKGSRACPVCKYGWYNGILFFAGNHPDWNDIRKWLLFLEGESRQRGKFLKVYFVYGNEHQYSASSRMRELERLGFELKLERLALTFVPSLRDAESEVNLLAINPAAVNTILVYRRRILTDKFIDRRAGAESFAKIRAALDRSVNDFFYSETSLTESHPAH